MNYQELLKRAKQNLPMTQSESRFEVPAASIAALKRATVIKNFSDVAKAVRRDPKHLAKFMFKELAVPGAISGNELVLNGKVSSSIINQRLQEYIKEYVICKECKKPDTTLVISEGIAMMKCEACGARKTSKVVK